MASIISAGTTSGTALNMAGDTSGVLQLATNGSTTAVTVNASQNVFMGNSGLISGTTGSPRLYVVGTTPIVDSGAGGQQLIVTSSETSGGDKGGVIGLAGPSAGAGVNIKATIAGKYDSAVGGNAGYMQFATLGSAGALVEQMRITSTGLLQFNSGFGSVATAYGCRAWVNFNGTGTVAIRASGNVTSITDNGTGDYTVNFTNAMPDANYCVAGWAKDSNNTGALMTVSAFDNNTMTSSACQIRLYEASVQDSSVVTVAFFR
jgi:hypothetical protein